MQIKLSCLTLKLVKYIWHYHVHHPWLYVETRPPIIWTGKNEYGRVEIWVDG